MAPLESALSIARATLGPLARAAEQVVELHETAQRGLRRPARLESCELREQAPGDLLRARASAERRQAQVERAPAALGQRGQRPQPGSEPGARHGRDERQRIVEDQRAAAGLQFGADLGQQLEGRLAARRAGQQELERQRARQRAVEGAQVLEMELARGVALGAGLAEQVLERVAFEQARAQRILELARCRLEQRAQVVARQRQRARTAQRGREAELDQLVVHQLADQAGRDALQAAVEDALLDVRGDQFGARTRQVGLVHQRRHDAALAPALERARDLHARRARRALAPAGLVVHRERGADARATVAVEDVGLGHRGVAELDQRLFDEVLDLLDAGQHVLGRLVAPAQRQLDHVRDLRGEERVVLAHGRLGLGDSLGDLLLVEGHLAPVALADAADLHGAGGSLRNSRSARIGRSSSRNCCTSLNSR